MRFAALAVVFVAFAAYSSVVAWDHGFFGFLSLRHEPWGLQVLLDLAIALFFFCSWMRRDCKERGQPFVPWMLLTALLGSIGALAYLVVRELQKKPR